MHRNKVTRYVRTKPTCVADYFRLSHRQICLNTNLFLYFFNPHRWSSVSGRYEGQNVNKYCGLHIQHFPSNTFTLLDTQSSSTHGHEALILCGDQRHLPYCRRRRTTTITTITVAYAATTTTTTTRTTTTTTRTTTSCGMKKAWNSNSARSLADCTICTTKLLVAALKVFRLFIIPSSRVRVRQYIYIQHISKDSEVVLVLYFLQTFNL